MAAIKSLLQNQAKYKADLAANAACTEQMKNRPGLGTREAASIPRATPTAQTQSLQDGRGRSSPPHDE
ncbi:hypothetical protein OAA19_03260 [Rubripirellula sp.]|nr:hypothetical protein [Rubripirellula sp.]MDB4339110.1 hypothetical protein [Rubripirellula sp.]